MEYELIYYVMYLCPTYKKKTYNLNVFSVRDQIIFFCRSVLFFKKTIFLNF